MVETGKVVNSICTHIAPTPLLQFMGVEVIDEFMNTVYTSAGRTTLMNHQNNGSQSSEVLKIFTSEFVSKVSLI